MEIIEASVPTGRASRYLDQLCRHTSQMVRMGRRSAIGAVGRHLSHRAGHAGGGMPEVKQVDYAETRGTVSFARGRWILAATPDALTLRVEAEDADALRDLREGITRRIESIGRREGLTVVWRQPRAPTASSDGTTSMGTPASSGGAGAE